MPGSGRLAQRTRVGREEGGEMFGQGSSRDVGAQLGGAKVVPVILRGPWKAAVSPASRSIVNA